MIKKKKVKEEEEEKDEVKKEEKEKKPKKGGGIKRTGIKSQISKFRKMGKNKKKGDGFEFTNKGDEIKNKNENIIINPQGNNLPFNDS